MVDDFGMDDDATCEVCGGRLEIVRPGKYQCPNCESLDALRASTREALFTAIDAAIHRDGHHKSYGVFVYAYGNRWEDKPPATITHFWRMVIPLS